MSYTTGHMERDASLPVQREVLLHNALEDLAADADVLAIYLSGSLAKQNDDNYSDIDLHTIVQAEKRSGFIENKRKRAKMWGEVLFYEDAHPLSPAVVTHYDCFVKVDSWYHALEEIQPSIWLKGAIVLYDPNDLINPVVKSSSAISYELLSKDVELWKGKLLAFVHETYRAVMREEVYYAEANLDRIRWLIVSGWFMEMDQHFDASPGSWSKVEGKRSLLTKGQHSMLKQWRCGKEAGEIMRILTSMVPEILRLNLILCRKVGVEANEEQFKKILAMVF
ncbi:hypothetical protein [Planococcus glaciei]|uniref:hypothetical protein n=1 Tax=Planococcus glaciei TaxID=459472 RepID=UPI001C72BADD|nr:hypothetical protein [Planococcus glaciei]MBX0314055.1 hypothetical protein [Planococcus glaciei]